MKFQSTKKIGGFSTVFRQQKSAPIRCSFQHGYFLRFKIWFEGELDYRNWTTDFGFLKRSKTKINYQNINFTPDEWFNYMFDHTTVIAEDDTELEYFKEGERRNILQLRIIKHSGCERFAELALVFRAGDCALFSFVIQDVVDRGIDQIALVA